MSSFRATATITWEFEAPPCLSDAERMALGVLDSLLQASAQNFSTHLALAPCQSHPASIQHKEYTPGYILAKVRMDGERVSFQAGGRTFEVKMNSQRYWLFKAERRCAACGLEGTRMVLETLPDGSNPHFNLYGTEEGKPVLFTKDHIKAKAVGGTDSMDNYQCMCAVCNQLKASYSLSNQSVRELRALWKNPRRLNRRELNRLIHDTRLVMMECLNGQ